MIHQIGVGRKFNKSICNWRFNCSIQFSHLGELIGSNWETASEIVLKIVKVKFFFLSPLRVECLFPHLFSIVAAIDSAALTGALSSIRDCRRQKCHYSNVITIRQAIKRLVAFRVDYGVNMNLSATVVLLLLVVTVIEPEVFVNRTQLNWLIRN